MKKKYKIVNKMRFYLFITSLFVILAVIVFSLLSNNKVHSSVHIVEFDEVEVVEGDTLWNIATRYLPEKTDIRKMIYDIKEFNQMDNGPIHPGDIIKIPKSYNN